VRVRVRVEVRVRVRVRVVRFVNFSPDSPFGNESKVQDEDA
jgi:hypothetical protein